MHAKPVDFNLSLSMGRVGESLLDRALAKAQVVLLLVILLIAAIAIFYVAQKELPKSSHPSTISSHPSTPPTPTSTSIISISPSPTPTATPIPVTEGPLTVVSVSLLQPYTPGGPTIEITLQNNATNPVVSLQAALTLSGRNYSYVFNDVSSNSPLLPNRDASQTNTLIDAGFETNQAYPLEIMGTLQNGSTFNFVVSVTITENSSLAAASGGNGVLELTMTLEKTTYSLGEPVNLTLTITNITNQTVNYEHTGLDFDFQVYNGTSNEVYQWSNFIAIPQFIAIVPLPAGASRSDNFTWSQTCNFNTQVEGDPVSSGTYSIIGQTGPTYGIQTTPIQLTILKP